MTTHEVGDKVSIVKRYPSGCQHKIIELSSCYNCPHFETKVWPHRNKNGKGEAITGLICKIGHLIENIDERSSESLTPEEAMIIPDWCPLDNAPEG